MKNWKIILFVLSFLCFVGVSHSIGDIFDDSNELHAQGKVEKTELNTDIETPIISDSGDIVYASSLAEAEPLPVVTQLSDKLAGKVTAQYKKCRREGGSDPICQTEAQGVCTGGSSPNNEEAPCNALAETYSLGDDEINVDIGHVLREVVPESKDIKGRILNLDKIVETCIGRYTETKNNESYFRGDILDVIKNGQPKQSLVAYSEIRQCQAFLGDDFINQPKSEGFQLQKLDILCEDLFKTSGIYDTLTKVPSDTSERLQKSNVGDDSCFRAANEDGITEKEARETNAEIRKTARATCRGRQINSGDETYAEIITAARQKSAKLDEQQASDSNTSDMIIDSKNAARDEIAIAEARLKECIDNEVEISKDVNSRNDGVKNVQNKCTKVYTAITEALRSDKSLQGELTTLLSGCISLNLIGNAVKEIDEDVKNGENTYTAINGKKCFARRGAGPYALDFESCKAAVYSHNTFFVTNNLVAPLTVQTLGALKQIEVQGDLARNRASGGVDAQTAGLQAQQKVYRHKANVELGMGILEGGKAATMFANMANYATPSLVSTEWCIDGNDNEYGLSQGVSCSVMHMMSKNRNIARLLFPNQRMKDFMLGEGASALSKAVTHMIINKTYKKQADLVGKVEGTLREAEFNRGEEQGFELGPRFCEENPTAIACRGGRGFVSRSGSPNISFSGVSGTQGGGKIDFADNTKVGSAGGGTNSAVRPSTKSKDDLSNILGKTSSKKLGNGLVNKIAAAGTKDAGGGGGGGGSGGGGGGASGGGGGGAPEREKQKAGGVPRNYGKKITGNYKSGSAGKFSSGNSLGKKRKSKNPFAAFSGSRKKRLRSIASEKQLLPKKVKLFEVISKRYAAVNNAERLKRVELRK